jgi:YD repeat-containing protein
MVAIIAGAGVGVSRSSAWVLGSRGQLGQATVGRGGENVYVNAANGNLVIQKVDEMLTGLGPDDVIARTYNSQGNFSDDNGDNWRVSARRMVTGLTGTVNTAGSTVKRVDWDGSEAVYTYDVARGAYVSKDGAGAYDTLTVASSAMVWTWTDGSSRVVELYDGNLDGRITSSRDTDGNALTFTYANNQLSRVTTADGYYTDLVYSGTLLTQVVTGYKPGDEGAIATLTRVRYSYDAQNRLSTVTVDLTPGDNAITDAKTYVTTYTYDGTSKRVASIGQTDGSLLQIVYVQPTANDYRVGTLTQTAASGVQRVTTFAYNTATRTTTVTDPAGQATSLVYDANGQLTRVTAPPAVSGGTAQITDFAYNANGDVTSVASGTSSVTYEYDANGNLTLERDLAGVTVTRLYGAKNELLAETRYLTLDPDGAGTGQPATPLTTRFVYDVENHLRFRLDSDGLVTAYGYNGVGQQTVVISLSANQLDISTWTPSVMPTETQMVDWWGTIADKSTGVRTDTAYDYRGNVTSVTRYGKLLAAGMGDTSDPTEVSTTVFIYDQAGNLLSRMTADGYGDPEGSNPYETFVYDGLGRLIASTDLRGKRTDIAFLDSASQTIVTLADGQTQTSTYNLAGELISYARSGAAAGQGVSTTGFVYDNQGRLRVSIDPTGLKTQYLYDRVGRKVADIAADGSLVEYVYNSDDRLVRTIRYKTALTSTQIATLTDSAGKPTTVELASVRPVADAAVDQWEWRVYDPAGRLVETIDAQGAVTEFVYDGASRLVSTQGYANLLTIATLKSAPPTSKVLPTAAPAYDRVTRNFYTGADRLAGTLDGEGYLTQLVYDKAGRLIETVRYATPTSGNRATDTFAQLLATVVSGAQNAKDIHERNIYDGQNRLRATVDGEGDVTRYNYTATGDVREEIRGQKLAAGVAATLANAIAAAALGPIETTTYQRGAGGLVFAKTKTLTGGGVETTGYGYDALGRLVSTLVSATGVSQATTRRYDLHGRLVGELSGVGSAALAALGEAPTAAQIDAIYTTYGATYAYDAADRLISKLESNGVDGAGVRTLYYYNSDGNLTHVINALGEVEERRYDALGRLSDVIVHGARIATSTLAGLTGGLVTAGLTSAVTAITNSSLDSRVHTDYNLTGTVSQTVDPLSSTTTYDYNAFGQLMATRAPTEGTSLVLTSRAYDRRGFLMGETRDAGAGILQLSTFFSLDAFGRTVLVTDPALKQHWTGYDRAGRIVTSTDGTGQTTGYSYDGRGNVLTQTDRNGKTTTFAYTAFNRQVTMTTPEGIVVTTITNAVDQTVRITDGAGRSKAYQYNADGDLVAVTDDLGGQTQNQYDAAGHLIQVTDPNGSKTSYTYDAADRLLTRTEDVGGLNLITKYEYSARGQQVKVTDPANRVTTITYDNGGRQTAVAVGSLRTEYSYDKRGRVLTVTEAATTGAARVTKYTYDNADRRIKTQVDPAGLNLTTQYAYDKNGNVVAVTDATNGVTRYVYDGENRVIWTVDPVGAVTNTTYDGEGRVLVTRAYVNQMALAGRPLTITADDITGAVATTTIDEFTVNVYDGDGRLRYVLNTALTPIRYSYDNAGNVIRSVIFPGSINPSWPYTVQYIDGEIARTGMALPTTLDKRVTRMAYDAANRLTFSIDATGSVTGYIYDQAGDVVKTRRYETLYTDGGSQADVTQATMVAWSAGLSGTDRVSRTLYDGAGRAAYQVDSEGYVSETQYDAAGRVTRTIRYADRYTVADSDTKASLAALIGALPATAAQTTYAYDSAGRLYDIMDALGIHTRLTLDALGQITDSTAANTTTDAVTTHRDYDKAGRVISETRGYVPTDPNAGAKTTWTYDGVGRVLTRTNPSNYVTTYDYDAAGRVKTETVPLDSGVDAITRYEYDAFGNRVKVTDARGNAGYFYYNTLDQLTLQIDPEGYATETSYAAGGEVASVKRYALKATNIGSVTTRPTLTPDAADAVTIIGRDRLGRVISTTDAMNFTESYTLNAFGDRITTTNRLGGVTTSTYDKRGLLTDEVIVFRAAAAGVSQLSVSNHYDYDGRGNRITAVEAYGLPEQRTTLFTYDKLDRLTKETGDVLQVMSADFYTVTSATPSQYLVYDKRGNIIQSTDAAGKRTLYYYDALDRKIGQIDALGTLSLWTYDKAGNAVSAKVYGDAVALPGTAGGTPPPPINVANYRETIYAYDRNNRLISTTVANLRTGQFVSGAYATSIGSVITQTQYDAMGNVVRQVDGRGGVTFSYYDKVGHKIAEVDPENYLTLYDRDGEGNVLREERLSIRLPSPVAVGTSPYDLKAYAQRDVYNDRTTTFAYDKNGRRVSETRANVRMGQVNAVNGALLDTVWNSKIAYSYNGLGQVTGKIYATNEFVAYFYDLQGRQTDVLDSPVVDYGGGGASTQHRVSTFYDGLSNVIQVREGRFVPDVATDHVTQYVYGAGGRLASTTDASGFTRNYAYDNMGHVVRETFVRLKAGGTTVTEGTGYRYDALGRLAMQTAITVNSPTSVTYGDRTWLRYDAFGEMTGKGITAAGVGTAVYQETFDYDAGGRMWRSTTGDGVTRLHLYDGAGAQTLTISSTGRDLAGANYSDIEAALNDFGTDAGVGNVFVAGTSATLAPTITVYDKRGQNIETRETFRELNQNAANPAVNDIALISHKRAYNAFGEVVSETDARNNVTDFAYNTLGKLIQKQGPTVNATAENGAITSTRPIDSYFYDLSGRLVAVRDANNNVTTRQLLSGTGYDGEEALVTVETHADNGVVRTAYDIFGNARSITNELNAVELHDYDMMGRLITVTHAGRAANTPGNPTGAVQALVDHYTYDGLGQRLTHWNALLGSSVTETTDYDRQGRVARTTVYGGVATSYAYVFDGTIATSGLGTFGGWTKTTTHVSGKTSVEAIDYYGHTTTRTDLGGHQFNYTFDKGGRVTQEVSVISGSTIANTRNYTYYNTGKLAVVADQTDSGDDHVTAKTVYGYDANGNRLTETYTTRNYGTRAVYSYNYGYDQWYDNYYETVVSYESYDYTTSHQNAVVTYDALNRMVSFSDTGEGGVVPATINYEYDAAGNVRHMYSEYRTLDSNGNPSGGSTPQDYWYRYDSMNRFVTTKGELSGARGALDTKIVRGNNGGVDILYDLAGQRKQAIWATSGTEFYEVPGNTYEDRYLEQVDYVLNHREDYTYTEDGYLSTVSAAEDQYDTNYHQVVAMGAPVQRVRNTRDLLGRVVKYEEYAANGATVTYSRALTYSARSEISDETVLSQGTTSVIHNDYRAETTAGSGSYTGTYLGGVVTHTRTQTTVSGTTTTSDTATSYVWWDGARQSEVVYKPNISQATTNRSTFVYDTTGRLSAVSISDGRPRTVAYVTNAEGQILSRREADNVATKGDPRQLRYQFDGRQLGDVSNDGPSDTDYVTALAQRGATVGTGAFKGGTIYGVSASDFDQSYDAINPTSEGTADTRITTREGDTLRSIAAQVWGDEAMWYLIAQANGLSASDAIAAGMTLIIPAKVANIHNTSATFRVYDPNKAIGDVNPTTQAQPKPQAKAKGCGTVGKIMMVVIAVAVAYVTAGAALTAMAGANATFASVGLATAVTAGAIGGAVGSIASQAFGVATGIQDKFSWKGVALAAIAGGVGGGVMKLPGMDTLAKAAPIVGGAVRGAVGNALTQGVSIAVGLQDKFDWTGVAVGGAVGGVMAGFGSSADKPWSLAGMTHGVVSGTAGAIAGAATRSLIDGSDFGDNILKALPDVIGSTIGNAIGQRIAAEPVHGQANKQAAKEEQRVWPNPEWVQLAAADSVKTDGGSSWRLPTNPTLTRAGQEAEGGGPVDEVIITAKRARNWIQRNIVDPVVGFFSHSNAETPSSSKSTERWSPLASWAANPALTSGAGRRVSAPPTLSNGLPDPEAQPTYTDRYLNYMGNRSLEAWGTMKEAFGQYESDPAKGGLGTSLNNASAMLKLASGGVSYLASPWTGTFDATIGSTLASATANAPHGQVLGLDYDMRLPTGFAGDAALTVGSFFVGGAGAGTGIRTTSLGRSAISAAELDVLPALSTDALPTGKSLILRPVEIEFPAGGLTSQEQGLFSAHLAEQEATLNRLSIFSPDDLALNLQNYKNVGPQIAKARSLARGYLPGSGQGLDAAHALDSVAGGYVNEFVGFRDPVQQRIGALWRTRANQIVPGREHMLTPRFDK